MPRLSVKSRWLLALSLLSLMALVTVSYLSVPPGINGAMAPAVTFRTLTGQQLTLEDLKGRPVLVQFWATNCSICMEELPDLLALYDEFHEQGFEVVAVAMAYDVPSHVVEFARARGLPYPVALDVEGTVAAGFKDVPGTPTSFLISPDGRIVDHTIGRRNFATLRTLVAGLLHAVG